jgi:hypothetical protein
LTASSRHVSRNLVFFRALRYLGSYPLEVKQFLQYFRAVQR